MHLKSSDWYAHHHEVDSNYDNVILHVVWEDDISVFRKDGTQVPTLELKNHISPATKKCFCVPMKIAHHQNFHQENPLNATGEGIPTATAAERGSPFT